MTVQSAAIEAGPVQAILGDSREALRDFPDNHFDSCVCDPPYALTSIVKRFGGNNAAPAKSSGATGVYGRAAAGFMGQKWDTGETAFDPEFWAEVLRVLKPGAHVLACGGTRTYHRLAVAIEDAGFDVRDAVLWHYGSGFPKSHDVSKGIDRAAGAEREVVGVSPASRANARTHDVVARGEFSGEAFITAPATEAARQWEGWGTALKPATEIIVLARKPLSEGTVAANVLRWGTGALNVGACRIETAESLNGGAYSGGDKQKADASSYYTGTKAGEFQQPAGRWPANLILEGDKHGNPVDEVLAGFPETGGAQSGGNSGTHFSAGMPGVPTPDRPRGGHDDSGGSAARYFYTAKADSMDRLGSKHPTVKPVDLMAYLVRLVTRKGGTVLDPFAGSGTTGEAAMREGCKAILIEREPTYYADIRNRMKLALAGPEERARAIVKASGKLESADSLPLFSVPAETDDPIYSCPDCDIASPVSRLTSGCPKCGLTMVPAE